MPKTKSPFANYANATLTFEIGDGQYSIDPVTLNPVEGKNEVVVKAILEATGGTVKEETKGIQEAWEVMKGYLVEPVNLSAVFAFNLVATADIEIAPGVIAHGTFKLMPVVNNPYVMGAGVDIITEVKGLFRRQR